MRNKLEIIGPFDEYRVTVNGYQVPDLQARRVNGLIYLSLSNNLSCDIPDDERALPVIQFIANAMAIAAGYSCFGAGSRPLNQYKRRLIEINMGSVEIGQCSEVEEIIPEQ
jgi:hypothetical protein